MKAIDIKSRIKECATLFEFEYNKKDGNIDPYYIQETDSYEYLLYFDGDEQTVYHIDDVMNTPFIDGKTLNEVANEIEVTAF